MWRTGSLGAIAAGTALHAYALVFKSEGGYTLFLFGLFLWSMAPYALGFFLLSRRLSAQATALFLFGCLFGDIYAHWAVFVQPTSSTAPLALLVMPFWNAVLLGPLFAALGWLGSKVLLLLHPANKTER